MIDLVANVALAALGVGALLCLYRIVTGPTVPDRAVGTDTLVMHVLAAIELLCIKENTLIFSDGILTIAILSFVGTTGLAKFIVKGVIIDRNHR